MKELTNCASVCEAEHRRTIVGVLERMLHLVEKRVNEDGASESECGGDKDDESRSRNKNKSAGIEAGELKHLMAVIKEMVAVFERLPQEERADPDSLAGKSDEELCNESARLCAVVMGDATPEADKR